MVCKEDKIDDKTIIQQVSEQPELEIIPLSSILHISPSSMPKYFKKNIGAEIKSGEIIAQKKGFLSVKMVKSPLSGKITEIDLKKGTLTISGKTSDCKRILSCPVPGKVKDISKNQIEIEIEAEIYHGLKGAGEEAVGILRFVTNNSLGVLDISFEVEKGIIVCKRIPEETVAKLEVLGAIGLIGNKIPQRVDLPWIQVDTGILEKLSEHNNKYVWLRPLEKEIIVYN